MNYAQMVKQFEREVAVVGAQHCERSKARLTVLIRKLSFVERFVYLRVQMGGANLHLSEDIMCYDGVVAWTGNDMLDWGNGRLGGGPLDSIPRVPKKDKKILKEMEQIIAFTLDTDYFELTRADVLPELTDGQKFCAHKPTHRKDGPRIPGRHGSYPTCICTKCNCWSLNIGTNYRWSRDPLPQRVRQEYP